MTRRTLLGDRLFRFQAGKRATAVFQAHRSWGQAMEWRDKVPLRRHMILHLAQGVNFATQAAFDQFPGIFGWQGPVSDEDVAPITLLSRPSLQSSGHRRLRPAIPPMTSFRNAAFAPYYAFRS